MSVLFRPKVAWITRSQPFGLKIARSCGSEGVPSLAVPVLQVIPLAVSRPERFPDAILFTSAQGVRLHPYDPKWKEIPVLTVGDGTALEALAKGYCDVRSAAGDVEDLKTLIATTLPRVARLFLFCARDASGDLDGFLRRSGYLVERHVVYETRSSTDAELRHAIDLLDRIDGICVYSPKGARRISELLRNHRWRGTIFCLSRACAKQIEPRDGINVEVAVQPTDRALRHLIRCRWDLTQSSSRANSASAPRPDFREFPKAARLKVANDNASTRSEQFSHAPEGADDEPPPTAA